MIHLNKAMTTMIIHMNKTMMIIMTTMVEENINRMIVVKVSTMKFLYVRCSHSKMIWMMMFITVWMIINNMDKMKYMIPVMIMICFIQEVIRMITATTMIAELYI